MQMKCVPQLDWVEFLETANKCPYQATESEELGPDSGLNFSANLPDSPAWRELPQDSQASGHLLLAALLGPLSRKTMEVPELGDQVGVPSSSGPHHPFSLRTT